MSISRGKNCFRNGKTYQTFIYNQLTHLRIDGIVHTVKEVEGAKAGPDIVLITDIYPQTIGIEVKRKNAFEGGSQKMKWDPEEKRLMFDVNTLHEQILGSQSIYDGINLPYYEGKKTYEDYLPAEPIFRKEIYIDISENTVSTYYQRSGVYYIQVEKKGLYHTGIDILNLNVPFFSCKQRLRIRTSKHRIKALDEKNKRIPTDVVGDINYDKKTLTLSPYSIDGNLPPSFSIKSEAE